MQGGDWPTPNASRTLPQTLAKPYQGYPFRRPSAGTRLELPKILHHTMTSFPPAAENSTPRGSSIRSTWKEKAKTNDIAKPHQSSSSPRETSPPAFSSDPQLNRQITCTSHEIDRYNGSNRFFRMKKIPMRLFTEIREKKTSTAPAKSNVSIHPSRGRQMLRNDIRHVLYPRVREQCDLIVEASSRLHPARASGRGEKDSAHVHLTRSQHGAAASEKTKRRAQPALCCIRRSRCVPRLSSAISRTDPSPSILG